MPERIGLHAWMDSCLMQNYSCWIMAEALKYSISYSLHITSIVINPPTSCTANFFTSHLNINWKCISGKSEEEEKDEKIEEKAVKKTFYWDIIIKKVTHETKFGYYRK